MPSTTEHPRPIWRPSPNFGPRRDGLRPSLVVIHYTAMVSAEAALERLCDPQAEVSAHYLIGGDGRLWQMVREEDRAWHAGVGSWHGLEDINSRSIGIELDNLGTHPFSDAQMSVLEQLLSQMLPRWGIAPEGVIGHSDTAPGRKQDPGARFDWARLARLGLARATPPANRSAEAGSEPIQELAHAAGYTGSDDPHALLQAVRMRYRPWARGPEQAADRAMLRALALDREWPTT
ncbi:N-acetylmuramoyl-L-alanine amidase [Ruegeria marisrubri]|uniref:N-acetylmuramoyl-L-alanine amidase n=1 Tax=Ruegeria marisrubri TaxID=1685379 RepID=A0A0X3TMT5_9RHOB|nr:N-acetylmuramoyl-L-alanine amidase [Ruegeria marisrubri]KUJ76979.1 N-acetylmuramoyl-L-alanine amidase [Ruegeria marisrubri]